MTTGSVMTIEATSTTESSTSNAETTLTTEIATSTETQTILSKIEQIENKVAGLQSRVARTYAE